jgi:hypothetical protein
VFESFNLSVKSVYPFIRGDREPTFFAMNRTEESRLVKNLLAATANNREKEANAVQPFNTADHNRAMPKRPASSNPTKRRSRSSSGNRQAARQHEAENAILPDRSSRLSKYDRISLTMKILYVHFFRLILQGRLYQRDH